MPSRKRSAARGDKTASVKGKLVEMIVASLHDGADAKVETNVRLPSLRNPKRRREIDVLLTGSLVGYPVRIAIECKNYKSIIGAPIIDAFIGKLQQVGIPTQHGIVVSAQGFTSGAIDRAKEVGITTLILTGLTSDRLAAEIISAVQSVVYLLPEITQLTVSNNLAQVPGMPFLWFLYDNDKQIKASIPDLVWKMWLENSLPSDIGEHEINIQIPEGWHHVIDGVLYPISSAKVKIMIQALLINIEGKATKHALIDVSENKVDKFRIHTSFEIRDKILPVHHFITEMELQEYLSQRLEPIKVNIGRYKLPRIRFNWMYWPYSYRAYQSIASLAVRCRKEARTPSNDELAAIEGSDLITVWEQIWEANPILKLLD